MIVPSDKAEERCNTSPVELASNTETSFLSLLAKNDSDGRLEWAAVLST